MPPSNRTLRVAGRMVADEPAWLRWLLIVAACAVVGGLIVVPLAYVFAQALRPGLETYFRNLWGDSDTRHAILLTLSVAPLAVVHHVGRKSGTAYRSPVLAFGVPGGYLIPLTYGPERDWVRNVVAAGTFELERRGRMGTVTDPQVRPGDHVEGLEPPWSTLVLRLSLDGVLTVRRATDG